MTQGTSPHRGSPSKRWADAWAMVAHWMRRWPAARSARRIGWLSLARGIAVAHLLALGLIVAKAGQNDPEATTARGNLPGLHLVFLIATGAAAALLALRPGAWAAPAATGDWTAVAQASPQLLAQMSHELRTPLNAMIGFSEVMLRELHGPLGHARYQEYATYINESGGRLLKASEDTLAVTATMSALVADRRDLRRERVWAAALVQEAWAAATAAHPDGQVGLAMAGSLSGEIECDRRAATRALEHLLREALAHASPQAAVETGARWQGDARCIEIRVLSPSSPPDAFPRLPAGHPRPGGCAEADRWVAGSSLRMVLARSLLELQGAELRACIDRTAVWSACVAFPTDRRKRDI
jgi:signal transduction histidine kinase